MTATKTTRMSPMRKHRALAGLAVLLLAAGLTGCATYVEVNSDPEGALITDRAGRSHGTAPVSIEYDRDALEAAGGEIPGLIATWPSGARAETPVPQIGRAHV